MLIFFVFVGLEFDFMGWGVWPTLCHNKPQYKSNVFSLKRKRYAGKSCGSEQKKLPKSVGSFCVICVSGLNVFVALIEFYVVNIFFDALLLASWTNHQYVVGVDHNVVTQTVDNGHLAFWD